MAQSFEALSHVSNKTNHQALSDTNTGGDRESSNTIVEYSSNARSGDKTCLHHFDTTRCAAAGMYGGLFLGTVGHQWYKGLDWFVSKVICPRTTSSLILSKVLLDTFVFGPIHITAFFSWMELSKSRTFNEIQTKLSKDFAPTFIADSAYWIPVQILNFKFVPVPLQLTVVNVACIFECAGLSFLSKFGWGGHAIEETAEAKIALVETDVLFERSCRSLVARQSTL